MLDEPGVVFFGRLVEQLVLSLALWPVSRPAACQSLIVLVDTPELLGGLCDGEQAARAEPVAVAGESVVAGGADDLRA